MSAYLVYSFQILGIYLFDYFCRKIKAMTKLQLDELHKLSIADKIKVVQTLWDDIAEEQAIDSISVRHKKILVDRLNKIKAGTATFKSWSEIQARFK